MAKRKSKKEEVLSAIKVVQARFNFKKKVNRKKQKAVS